MRRIFQKPYIYALIVVSLLYLALNVYASKFYLTLFYLPIYFKTINWLEFAISLIFSIVISILVAANAISIYLRYQERQMIKKSAVTSCLATVGGLATGICPVCATSFFPLLLGTMGVTFSWAMLPFKGFEVQLFIIIALSLSIYYLNKNTTSSAKVKKNARSSDAEQEQIARNKK